MKYLLWFVLVLTLTLSGCGASTSDEAPAHPPPSATPTPALSTAVADSDDSRGEPMEDLTKEEHNSTESAPNWDTSAERAATDRAIAFMRAFARPDLSDEDWHGGIAGFMTDQGAQTFAYVDPTNVPVSSVQGAEALPNVSPSLAEVQVDTDAGPYLVTLIRTSADTPWLVEYTEPME